MTADFRQTEALTIWRKKKWGSLLTSLCNTFSEVTTHIYFFFNRKTLIKKCWLMFALPHQMEGICLRSQRKNMISSAISCSFKRRFLLKTVHLWTVRLHVQPEEDISVISHRHLTSRQWITLIWLEVCFYISRALILLLAVTQYPAHIKKERKEKKDREKNENKRNPFYPW